MVPMDMFAIFHLSFGTLNLKVVTHCHLFHFRNTSKMSCLLSDPSESQETDRTPTMLIAVYLFLSVTGL